MCLLWQDKVTDPQEQQTSAPTEPSATDPQDTEAPTQGSTQGPDAQTTATTKVSSRNTHSLYGS